MYSFRTLATDIGFQHVVKEEMLLRLLDAFVWKNLKGARNGLPTNLSPTMIITQPVRFMQQQIRTNLISPTYKA